MLLGLRDDVRWSTAFNWRKDFEFSFNDGERDVRLLIVQQPINSPVGFVVWEASFLLCNHLVKQYGVAGRTGSNGTAVELGAGCGLVGMCAARLGFDVWLTDRRDSLSIAQRNVAANQLNNVDVCELDCERDACSTCRLIDLCCRGQRCIAERVADPCRPVAWLGAALHARHDGVRAAARHDRSIVKRKNWFAFFRAFSRLFLPESDTSLSVLLMVYEDRGCNERHFFDVLLQRDWSDVRELQATSFHPGLSPLVHLMRVSNKRIAHRR